ncbi:MAG: hypothetical protein ACE15C_03985 [Phycisphaerae bacterium]
MTTLTDTTVFGSHEIHAKLRKAWRKERRFVHTRGLCSLLLWVVALALLDFVIDWLFLSSSAVGETGSRVGRVVLLAIDAVVLGWIAWRRWLRLLRKYDPVRVALQVENRHPELRSLLVSYIQLEGPLPPDSQASPVLLTAFRHQAVDETRPINFREIVNYRELKRLFAVSAAAFILFGVISFTQSDYFTALLYRLMGSQIAYPTRTHVEDVKVYVGKGLEPAGLVRPDKAASDGAIGQFDVKYGEPVTIVARCTGALPSEGALRYKPANGAWGTYPMQAGPPNDLDDKDTRGAFHSPIGVQAQDFLFSVKIGDDRSPVYRVRFISPPRIAKAKVLLKYPAFTGMGKHPSTVPAEAATQPGTGEMDDLNLQVPESTEITWQLRFDVPLRSAEMVRDVAESISLEPTTSTAPSTAPAQPTRISIPLTLSDDGRTATYTTVATESFPYSFRWVEREHGYPYEDLVRYILQVDQDVPPDVEIIQPTQDGKATIRKKLTIRFRAEDNYGLSDVSIIAQLNDGQPVKVSPYKGPLTGKSVEADMEWKLADSFKDLKEGDNVLFTLEAADNHEEKAKDAAGKEVFKKRPFLNRSRSFRLTIVSDAEYRRWMLEEMARQMKEIEAMKQEETEASKAVDVMKNPSSQPSPEPSSGPASSPAP